MPLTSVLQTRQRSFLNGLALLYEISAKRVNLKEDYVECIQFHYEILQRFIVLIDTISYRTTIQHMSFSEFTRQSLLKTNSA